MKQLKQTFLVFALMIVMVNVGWGQTLYDSYSDGNFTLNPVWGGNTFYWEIVANSDAAAGATGSNTLRLKSVALSQTDYLSSQINTWGDIQEWGFWVGRRSQAFTGANQSYIWLYANESNLTSATVDGYRLAIGDDTGGDEIRLEYILNGAVSSTVITSSGAITNTLTDIGFLVRVTRSNTGVWTLYTSTLPTANGTGSIATDIPNSTNASVNQGSATNNTIVPTTNGYLGVAALHSTGANAIIGAEFDQIYFTPTSAGLTPPSLTADNIDNNVDNNIDITFTDDATWRGLISAVKIGGTALTVTTDYVITAGNLQLKPSGLNILLTTSGSKAVTVEATGYTTASITQQIDPGAPTSNSTATINTALSLGATRTVTCTAKDQYNNLVSGYTFKYDATITNNNVTTSESYNINGTARTSSVTDLDLTTTTNASGVAIFTIIMPASVDVADGISVQVQLSNGTTNIGSAFPFTQAAPQITLTGIDPSTSPFSQGSSNNVLYRIKIDVANYVSVLSKLDMITGGNYLSTDIQSSGIKLWYSTDANFGGDANIGSLSSSSTGTGEVLSFTGLSQSFSIGTAYLFITADITSSAVLGRTISGESTANGDLTFSNSSTFSGGSFTSANLHSIAELPLLIFSEYVEGTSNNKAIELYNASTSTINLADYVITLFNNGTNRPTPSNIQTFINPTYLAPGATYVIVNASANATLKNYANLVSSTVTAFNGNDALAIYRATDVTVSDINVGAVEVDIIGKIGQNPGTEWTGGSLSTLDRTLRRKNTIYSPVTTNPSSFDPSTEYDGYATDVFTDLGIHDFGGTITTTQTLPIRTYTNLTINGGGINVSLSGSSLIKNSFTMSNGTLSIGNYTLTLNGTCITSNGTLTGSSSSNLTIGGTGVLGTLVFTSGARELQNLVINRTSSGTVTLGTDLLVNTLLTLTSGVLNTDATNKLTLGTDATISGGSATSFVNGPFNLNTNTTSLKTVHIGSGSIYRTVGITPSTTDATTYTIQFYNSGQSLGNTYLSPLVTVSSLEYFDIDRSSGTSDAKVTLSWSSNSGITNLTDLRVAHWNSINSRWESAGVDGFTGTETSGTITSTVVSSFSPFVLGSVSNQPLPIVLSSFNSNYVGRNIKLNWVTASETNNAGFNVERAEVRSQNLEFSKIGFISGHGTVNTPTNYSFEDKNLQTGKYKYRLKQIDHNGNYEYFELNGEVEIGVPKKYDLSQNYPNPFNPVTKINFDLPVDSKVTMLIYDITGREVAKLLNGEFKKAGYHTTNFNASSLSSGVYFYSLSTDAFRMTKKMVLLK